MRDAIVYGYDWNGGSGPVERIALALARVGAKVLHCDSAASVFKKPVTTLKQVERNLYTFKPSTFISRLNRYKSISGIQGSAIARQILERAQAIGLADPIFVYGRLGRLVSPLCAAMRAEGFPLIHLYTDSFGSAEEVYVGQSDRTVVFSRTAYHRLRARWGQKVHHSFFGIDLLPFRNARANPASPPDVLAGIPRPRLGYAGSYAEDFLNLRVLRELLERRADWSFVSFQSTRKASGMKPAVPLPNAHAVPWQGPEGFVRCLSAFDVGFIPYDCSNAVLLNGPPMKLWDYFALGLPVVGTPLIHLWEYDGGMVYLGETAEELEAAVEKALAEPADSPLRAKRREEAEKHSVEALGRALETILG